MCGGNEETAQLTAAQHGKRGGGKNHGDVVEKRKTARSWANKGRGFGAVKADNGVVQKNWRGAGDETRTKTLSN
jgi:hypothetical protein